MAAPLLLRTDQPTAPDIFAFDLTGGSQTS